jgi:hypothetical protein
VERPGVHRPDGALQRRLRGHQHHGRRGVEQARGVEHAEAVDAGHAHVAHHHVGAQLGHALHPGAAAHGRVGGEAFAAEQDAQGLDDGRLVVDDQDGRHRKIGIVVLAAR